MKPYIHYQFKLKPFWFVLQIAFVPKTYNPQKSSGRYFLLFGVCAGKHDSAQMLAEGYEYGLWPPQIVQGLNTFWGLHWLKITKYHIAERQI